jgi:hypothetical protein
MTLKTDQGPRGPASCRRHRPPFNARRWLWDLPRWPALTSVVLALGAAAAVPAHSSATATPAPTPDALMRAQAIRADVNARYRLLHGRKLVVTGATSTGGASMLVLMTADWLEGRIVPTDDGIFFDTCSARATCPYPVRRAAWPVAAVVPRRQALELALRTFLETTVSLVVVSLPTPHPVWVVFERDVLLADMDAPAVLDRLASSPATTDLPLRELVVRLTRPRLVAPVAIGPDDSIVAVRLFGGSAPTPSADQTLCEPAASRARGLERNLDRVRPRLDGFPTATADAGSDESPTNGGNMLDPTQAHTGRVRLAAAGAIAALGVIPAMSGAAVAGSATASLPLQNSTTATTTLPGDSSVPFWPYETGVAVGTSETYVDVRADGSYLDPGIGLRVSLR